MAITKAGFETLYTNGGRGFNHKKDLEEKVSIDELYEVAVGSREKWDNFYVDNRDTVNFNLTDDMRLRYKTTDGEWREADITEFAFGQLCSNIEIPASYVKKCMESGKTDLAINNFKQWANDCNKMLLIRENEGVVRAVLSEKYQPFDNDRAIRTVKNMVDRDKFMLQGAYLSEDKMHLRYISREPLRVANESSPMYGGFSISNSGVGKGSFNMVYYLYRQWCDNGAIVTDKKGTLFRQAHSGSRMTDGKIELLSRSLQNVEFLNDVAIENIRKNQAKELNELEMRYALESARHFLKLSEKAQENITGLIDSTYGKTKWGFYNAITDVAHDYTLDTRINFETFAGNGIFETV